jgi:tRNA A37 methylthiotransferase MiaB
MSTACIAYGDGCPRARVDTALLLDYFRVNGWVVVESIETADLVLVTSCGFDSISEELSFRLLEAADRRRKPGSRLVVVGCLAAMSEERLKRVLDATPIPPRDSGLLDEIIGASVRISDVPDPHHVEPAIALASRCFGSRERWGWLGGRLVDSGVRDALVKLGFQREPLLCPTGDVCSLRVAVGCTGACAYCAIRLAYGPLRSKPTDHVLAEFDAALSQGHTEFKLLAQDLGAYGQDIGTNLAGLLRGIFERPGDFRLQMNDVGIRWIVKQADDLGTLLYENAAKVRMLHMPLESGSDRILGVMRRGHTASEAEEVFQLLRAAAPDMLLATHVMVGFPGETEEDFLETARVLRSGGFDRVHVFDYSDRSGTVAAGMPGKVPPRVIRSRSRRLRREFGVPISSVEYALWSWILPSAPRWTAHGPSES